jgi:DNA-directed RNA polymerase specialized sigma24 family protein
MRHTRARGSADKTGRTRDERFARYFARLFSYAFGLTGDEEAAREVSVAAFAVVLPRDYLEEEDFAVALFTAARKMTSRPRNASANGLTPDEQEIISLVFDAQLTRSEIARLLGLHAEAVVGRLVSGLRKLRDVGKSGHGPSGLEALSA